MNLFLISQKKFKYSNISWIFPPFELMDFPRNFQILNITSSEKSYCISFILNFILYLIRAIYCVHFTGNNSCLVVFEKPFENIHVAWWGDIFVIFFFIEYFHPLFLIFFLKYSFKRYVLYIPIQKKFLKQKILNLNAWNWNTSKSSYVRGCP